MIQFVFYFKRDEEMLRKCTLVSLLGLASSTVAFGSAAPACPSFVYHSAPYVGIGFGGIGLHHTIHAYIASALVVKDSWGDVGDFGAVYGGYQFVLPANFNVAVEAFGDLNSLKMSRVTNTPTNVSTTMRNDYGVRLLPGYRVAPNTEAYLILGYVRGSFKFSDLGAITQMFLYTNSFSINGAQLGLGAGFHLPHNIVARLDGYYTIYQGKSFTPVIQGTAITYKNNLNAISVLASVAYRFDF